MVTSCSMGPGHASISEWAATQRERQSQRGALATETLPASRPCLEGHRGGGGRCSAGVRRPGQQGSGPLGTQKPQQHPQVGSTVSGHAWAVAASLPHARSVKEVSAAALPDSVGALVTIVIITRDTTFLCKQSNETVTNLSLQPDHIHSLSHEAEAQHGHYYCPQSQHQ